MPAESVDALASVIANKPGAYAFLVGSGVSRAAGIPTAWQIILDLIRQLVAEGGQSANLPEAELVEWYEERYGTAPDYSDLVEALAPSPGDRLALLDRYFDPDEDDEQQGLRQPTEAHRSIAQLAKMGMVKVIVTTNFDRLIESALEEVGIQPTIVQSDSDAETLAPIHSVDCLLVKLHGDRRSPDFKNTTGELQEYSEGMMRLLAQILSEYGLLVVGWSGIWDPALRRAMTEYRSGVFSTFFAHRGRPADDVSELLHVRHAAPIEIDDADQFFGALLARVLAIIDLRATATDLDLAGIKRLIPYPEHRIRLRDAVEDAVDDLLDRTASSRYPLTLGSADWSEIVQRYEDLVSDSIPLATMLAAIAYYGDEERHRELVRSAVLRLAERRLQRGGVVLLVDAQHLPATVCLLAAGVGWHASGDTGYFVRTVEELRTESGGDSVAEGPLVFSTAHVVSSDALHGVDYFGGTRSKAAASRYIADQLKPALGRVVPEGDFDDLFDDVEYLLGLATYAVSGRAYAGRWPWRDIWSDPPTRVMRFHRIEDRLLDAGVCNGDREALAELHDAYESWVSQRG